ncbi:uncharacterized protein BDCG_16356 [Blastomyces dermatitidis ER-3]|uniref:Methionyl-tRNA synthetase n=3 Tax=Blastomyces TaxID=229219 RepID=A0A179V3R4_BLAGS|nr:uncharacterized protein BDBG_17950 [Blastomyces gilchristii SLH14081]XP_045279584.1 uncharacterized protein BDCG_16356 [Blastomyces dermatitidis ER-3]EGE83278.2 methionyl-tRNA synthetase [Blastomyces dermatitidis ATCC 18188]EQL28459.1 hypothetical protein BDFG_08771 [Blastomyces dermatitidis ATCC 26199]OAS99856.1 hypothetical protein BDCG_16356 [Blastomyces dermatitidis ER-3]OAT13981.1 hypothetical protein BDBG_17950 [Blastomyces gilchristii SLH14081]
MHLASIIAPYIPDTAESICTQLRVEESFPIPYRWSADSIKPGRDIGNAKLGAKHLEAKR